MLIEVSCQEEGSACSEYNKSNVDTICDSGDRTFDILSFTSKEELDKVGRG